MSLHPSQLPPSELLPVLSGVPVPIRALRVQVLRSVLLVVPVPIQALPVRRRFSSCWSSSPASPYLYPPSSLLPVFVAFCVAAAMSLPPGAVGVLLPLVVAGVLLPPVPVGLRLPLLVAVGLSLPPAALLLLVSILERVPPGVVGA